MAADRFDVVVYGGTPAGLIAAVAATRAGASALVLEPSGHIGGMSASGLVTAESEHMLLESFSGPALEFFDRVGRAYGQPGPLFYWESKVAERVFAELVADAAVSVRCGSSLERVDRNGESVDRVVLADGASVPGRVFVDGSYEGDLMAAAAIPYAVGREPRGRYDEPLAGIRYVEHPGEVAGFNGELSIDAPVDVVTHADGALLPGLVAPDGIVPGAGDGKPMAYNFRITVSRGHDRVPIEAPPGYDPQRFELVARYLRLRPETRLEQLLAFSPFASGRYRVGPDGRTLVEPGDKWELNNRQNAVVSLGHLGGQFAYPEADPAQRREIWQDHRDHNQGLLFFLANDPEIPAALRRAAAGWGLAPDEYVDHGHWPYQLYVREARRMVGAYVMTQHDIQRPRVKPDAIAVGSHWIDSHHVQRVAIGPRQFRNEGRIWTKVNASFHIPYRAITRGATTAPTCSSRSACRRPRSASAPSVSSRPGWRSATPPASPPRSLSSPRLRSSRSTFRSFKSACARPGCACSASRRHFSDYPPMRPAASIVERAGRPARVGHRTASAVGAPNRGVPSPIVVRVGPPAAAYSFARPTPMSSESRSTCR